MDILGTITSSAINSGLSGIREGLLGKNEGSGVYDDGNNLYRMRQLRLSSYICGVNAKDIKRIDDYFTRFGYAQNKIMKPNPTARPYYTFIQTGDPCYTNVHGYQGSTQGSANAKQIAEINALLMRGVTFWRRNTTKDDIFKYETLDNSPVT